jgi:hypothetical protein
MGGPYTLVFRIRRCYYDLIVSGEKTREVREAKSFWAVRALRASYALYDGIDVKALFLCGKGRRHVRRVTAVLCFSTTQAALGRAPSEQGLRDIGTGPCYGFELGEEIPEGGTHIEMPK